MQTIEIIEHEKKKHFMFEYIFAIYLNKKKKKGILLVRY